MKILILGGGQQGSVIAEELSKDFNVTVADLQDRNQGKFNFVQVDLSNYEKLSLLLRGYDLCVGALPSALGFKAVFAAINNGVNYVDLSFCKEDLYDLNQLAVSKNTTVFADCGIAPGISNLVVGRALFNNAKNIHIKVGGVATTPKEPFGYSVSWNLDDLVEEYSRPAKLICDGKVVEMPALSDLQIITAGKYEMEEFNTDGLRSLLRYADKVENMTEKTLRWKGHVAKIIPLLATGALKDTLLKECKIGKDKLVMVIEADDNKVIMNIDHTDKYSAMSRGTAFSCAAFAKLLANGFNPHGVMMPEDIAVDIKAYKFILDDLAAHGVEFDTKYPFV